MHQARRGPLGSATSAVSAFSYGTSRKRDPGLLLLRVRAEPWRMRPVRGARHPGLDRPHATITVGLWHSNPSDIPVGPSALGRDTPYHNQMTRPETA